MRIRVQVVIEGNEDVPPEVHEVADLQRADLGTDTLGLHLAEAKELLARMQEVVVDVNVGWPTNIGAARGASALLSGGSCFYASG